ncbi:MAG: LamB/YcsF family protein [Pyrinomonadaceae bacterium]
MLSVDLNCDMGESFGAYSIGHDEEIVPFVTSINIACGFHAGDPKTMRRTVDLAIKHGCGIGAHPGFEDLLGFGRRDIEATPQEVCDLVTYQIGALYGFVKATGAVMQHVKPHGALYNMAARRADLADAIATAVQRIDKNLLLFGLSGSELIRAGKQAGLRTVSEVFADRTYQQDGSLTSRRLSNAVIDDPRLAAEHALKMVRDGRTGTVDGSEIEIKAETICIHGDTPNASNIAREIRKALAEASIEVSSPAHFLHGK